MLNIGTYKNVVTVLRDTRLIVVLQLLAERKISAVPVVDENGIFEKLLHADSFQGSIFDIYTRSDVTVQDSA